MGLFLASKKTINQKWQNKCRILQGKLHFKNYQFKTENIVRVFIQFSLQFIGFHTPDSELQEIKNIIVIILAPIINFIFSFSISFDWRIANHLKHINFEIKNQKILIRKKNPAKHCQKFREITFHKKNICMQKNSWNGLTFRSLGLFPSDTSILTKIISLSFRPFCSYHTARSLKIGSNFRQWTEIQNHIQTLI